MVRLPSLAVSIYKAVDTNLSLSEMTKLARSAGKLTDANIVTQTLPGKFLDLDGGSYWEVDPVQARLVIADIMEGRAGDKVVMGQTTINTGSQAPAGATGAGSVTGGVIPQNSGENNTKTSGVASGGTGVKEPAEGNTGTNSKPGASGTDNKPGSTSGQSKTNDKPDKNTTVTSPPASMIVPGAPQDEEESGNEANVTIKPRG